MPGEPRGIASAIPILVVVADDRDDWIGEANRGKKIGSDICVPFHLFEFGGREFSRLVQNEFWNGQLSHIVKKSRCLDRLQLRVVIYAEALCQLRGEDLNASDVTMSDLILCVDCHC
jgi:hypothetical protein